MKKQIVLPVPQVSISHAERRRDIPVWSAERCYFTLFPCAHEVALRDVAARPGLYPGVVYLGNGIWRAQR